MCPTYSFECEVCHKPVEHFLRIADRASPGPCKCGGTLRRIITPPVVLIDGTDPSFPSAAAKWEKDRTVRMKAELKNRESTGVEYPNKRTV